MTALASHERMTPLGTLLPTGWTLEPLGSVCTKIGSGATPRGGSKAYVDSGTAFIRSQNVFDHRFSKAGLAFIDENAAEKLTNVCVESHDVLLNITGDGDTIARCCVVPTDLFPARVSQHVVIIRAGPEIVPEYLQRYLSHPSIRQYMLNHNSGGSRRALTKGQIEKFQIIVPPFHEQRAIAEVLGALDDKIAANTKLAATADELLSTRFAELLREGYEFIRLGDIADVNAETTKPTLGGELRYIDIASVSVGSYDLPELSAWGDAPSRARRAVRKGDTLWSTVRPNRRSHALNLSSDPSLVGSTGLAVLTPRALGWAYLYEVTKRPEFTAYLETVAEGSAYPAVRADKFEDAPVPLLSDASRQLFESLAEPLREAVHALSEENRSLSATRDALLPQLMSGKLQVREAEELVSAVV